jgi:SNF2 family DNA or RNA helicase
MDLLPELLDEGRRVLVFSQFTSMLGLIEAELGGAVSLCQADRQTRGPRDAEMVRRFQAGEVPLFLISLKAGGTGLNLTAADTVIHYDPWWNPAVEPGHRPRPPHRPGQAGVRLQAHRAAYPCLVAGGR